MADALEQPMIDFYQYPPIGGDDWEYAFETAQVRVLETQMLSRTALMDMANARDFEQGAELLRSTEYALPAGGGISELERILSARRSAVRQQFADWMHNKTVVKLFQTRDDFANLRLALRRTLTGKPLGTGYSGNGNVSPEIFTEAFEQENYELFSPYMQQAIEQAVIAYYQYKDIRWIDYTIDRVQAQYNLTTARRLKSLFLLGLFRIQIDLTNIRTMLRLKFTESQQRKVFVEGGYIEFDRLEHGLELGYESVDQLFFVMPYHQLVETGTGYLASDKSFLKLERQCEDYLTGFLKTTAQITVGPQPIIAYLLMKENEIRSVRLILTAKRNSLDTRLILDRIS
ncbi:MAG: V-type ATPase subunit [Sedimentisphaerales bacterium]|nr:V-type ATPase subunit [Sedimentisphaerales bacterium]